MPDYSSSPSESPLGEYPFKEEKKEKKKKIFFLSLLFAYVWEFYIGSQSWQLILMSSNGLNKWIVSGHLAADAEIKTVDLRNGEKAKVAKATIYVRKSRNKDESFTVSLSIWEGASAWRKLPFLKKGSLIICTGSVEPHPYLSNSDNLPRAGLSMNVLDVDLDNVRYGDDEEALENVAHGVIEQVSDLSLSISGSANQPLSTSKTLEKVEARTQTKKVLVGESSGKQSKEEPKAPAEA